MIDKFKAWLAVKWEHFKDYVAPYTEKLEPTINDIKYKAEPYVDKAKETLTPAVENAKAKTREMVEKGKEKAQQVKEAREIKKSNIESNANMERRFNKKLIPIIALIAVALIALVVMLVINGNNNDEIDTTNPTTSIEQENVTAPTLPPVEDRGELKDDTNRPTFTIGGTEYEFGCTLSKLLEKLEIENIETYLAYNRKALIIQPGKTREWTLCDKDGNKCYVEIYNPTEEELSSEYCLVYSVAVRRQDIGDLGASFVGGKIDLSIEAKSIVDILGQVSGRSEFEEDGVTYNAYRWSWLPYSDNAYYTVFVRVETDSETGEIARIFIQDETVYK